MSKLLASILLAAAALAAPAVAKPLPPGTCALAYGPQAIPGDAGHQAYGVRMDILPGRVANWHAHNAVEYLSLSSGSGWLEIEGHKPITLTANRFVMIPSHAVHRLHNTSKTAHLVWSGFFVGAAPDKQFTDLHKGDTAWTPGCPTHF